MPVVRDALSSVLGDHTASTERHTVPRHTKRPEKGGRKGHRNGSSSVVAMQAMQAQLSYEIVKEQRFLRIGDTAQARRCRSVITALQDQLAAYQPVQRPYQVEEQEQHLIQPQQAAYRSMRQPMPSTMPVAAHSSPTCAVIQQQQEA